MARENNRDPDLDAAPSSARKGPPRQSPPAPNQKNAALPKPAPGAFPVVGLGSSAGGLEAFEKFFTNLPGDSGMVHSAIKTVFSFPGRAWEHLCGPSLTWAA